MGVKQRNNGYYDVVMDGYIVKDRLTYHAACLYADMYGRPVTVYPLGTWIKREPLPVRF